MTLHLSLYYPGDFCLLFIFLQPIGKSRSNTASFCLVLSLDVIIWYLLFSIHFACSELFSSDSLSWSQIYYYVYFHCCILFHYVDLFLQFLPYSYPTQLSYEHFKTWMLASWPWPHVSHVHKFLYHMSPLNCNFFKCII